MARKERVLEQWFKCTVVSCSYSSGLRGQGRDRNRLTRENQSRLSREISRTHGDYVNSLIVV